MTDPDYRGPTADELMPTQRINEGLLYQEHLVALVGEQQALRGVPLEIVDAVGGTLKGDPAGKKTKATILLTFKGPDGKALPQKLGINATIKKALIDRFDSRVLAQWVGWVTLFVDPSVVDKRTGELVRAIRVKNVGPKLKPTFDYAANVSSRIARARKARDTSASKSKTSAAAATVELTAEQRAALDAADTESAPAADPPPSGDLADQIAAQMAHARLTDEERAAIEAAERGQFTADPDQGDDRDQ